MSKKNKGAICFENFEFDNPSNPLRHFPQMPGRGRPPQTKRWDMVAEKSDGTIIDGKFKGTKAAAYKKANSLIKQGYMRVLVDGPFRTQRAASKAMKRVKRKASRAPGRTVPRRAQSSVGIIPSLFGFDKPARPQGAKSARRAAIAAAHARSSKPRGRTRRGRNRDLDGVDEDLLRGPSAADRAWDRQQTRKHENEYAKSRALIKKHGKKAYSKMTAFQLSELSNKDPLAERELYRRFPRK